MGDMADYLTDQIEYAEDEYAGCWVCTKCGAINSDEDAACYRCLRRNPALPAAAPTTREDRADG